MSRPAFADHTGRLNAHHFDCSSTIAGIVVVQNLSRFKHDASLSQSTLSQRNLRIQQTHSLGMVRQRDFKMINNFGDIRAE